jgi:hypothetical protein
MLGVARRQFRQRLSIRGKQYYVHRVLYEALIGPVPDGLVLDHECCHRGCVNPYHLEPVTVKENTERGAAVPFTRVGAVLDITV